MLLLLQTYVFEAIQDSLSVIIPIVKEIADNSSPDPYTIYNIKLSQLNNTIACIAAVCGIFSAVYGYLSYKWSKRTAENVARVSVGTQLRQIEDYIECLFRTIVYSRCFLQSGERPTDSVYNSIMLPDTGDYFKPSDYVDDPLINSLLREIKQRNINFNREVNIAIACDSLSYDNRANIERKPLIIINRVCVFCSKLINKDYNDLLVAQIVHWHLSLTSNFLKYYGEDGLVLTKCLMKYYIKEYESSVFKDYMGKIFPMAYYGQSKIVLHNDDLTMMDYISSKIDCSVLGMPDYESIKEGHIDYDTLNRIIGVNAAMMLYTWNRTKRA